MTTSVRTRGLHRHRHGVEHAGFHRSPDKHHFPQLTKLSGSLGQLLLQKRLARSRLVHASVSLDLRYRLSVTPLPRHHAPHPAIESAQVVTSPATVRLFAAQWNADGLSGSRRMDTCCSPRSTTSSSVTMT